MYDKLENISEVWYTEDGVSTKAYEYHYTAFGQLARFDNLLTGKSIAYTYDKDSRLIGFVEYDINNVEDTFSYTAFYDENSRASEVRYSLDYAVGTENTNADVRYSKVHNAETVNTKGLLH